MFGKSGKPSHKIDSLIGAGTVIEGNVCFSGGLRIDGQVRGNVSTTGAEPGMLVISEQARIDGEVNVAHVVVNGAVNGPVISSVSLELQPRAKITGDVRYRSIEIHLGAVMDGKLLHEEGGT